MSYRAARQQSPRRFTWIHAVIGALALLAGACGPELAKPTLIGPEGGTIQSALGLTIVIPPRALASEVVITLDAAEDAPGALQTVALGPEGLEFAQGVSISFELPRGTTAPEQLSIFEQRDGEWQPLPDAIVDVEKGRVSATTTRTGMFALMALDCRFGDGGCTGRDGGSTRDGGTPIDGGTRDGGTTTDGGIIRDGGTTTDGGIIRDGGTTTDGGIIRDGGTPFDGGSSTDGGTVPRDGGTTSDGGVSPRPDGGFTTDAG